MNSDAQTLVSRANALVAEVIAKGERRKRYSPELRSIVRSLVLKHKFSVPQTIAVIPISHASVRKGGTKRTSVFKKIAVKENPRNIPDKYLNKIMAALGLLTISQTLLLALNLFLG